MKTSTVLLACCLLGPGVVPPAEGEEPPAGDAVLARIEKASRAFEAEYVGAFSRRRGIARELDPDDGELVSTKEFVVDVWEYHGEHPVRVVRECRIDGEKVERAECEEEARLEPAYRIFAADASRHYRYEYGGTVERGGQATHRIRVVPLEKTSRHLEGEIFYSAETLLPVAMDMTLAAYPFGLEDLSIELRFADKNGEPVLGGGRTVVEIYVPLLMDQKTVTEFTASRQRLLKEREAVASAG